MLYIYVHLQVLFICTVRCPVDGLSHRTRVLWLSISLFDTQPCLASIFLLFFLSSFLSLPPQRRKNS